MYKQVIKAYIKYIVEEHTRKHGESTESLVDVQFRKWYNIYYTIYDKSEKLKIPTDLDNLLNKLDNIDITFESKL